MTFKPPEAGELDLLATLEEFKATGYDANGQPTGNWQVVGQEYVKREGLSGRSVEMARQLFATATHNIYCRYNVSVTRTSRFTIAGVIYAIGWVDNHGTEWMRCTVEESWPETVEKP